ncbi:RNA-binding domain-containing protein [Hypoxylon sp. FL1150]|nr:RNA-binding domain-containing protein [Hypoxylon sp. FL1150]
MDYQPPSRDRYGSRSPTPRSRYSQSPSPVRRRRSPTRSASPPRRNGRFHSESRSPSRDRDDRDDRDIRDDRGRSESPLRGSTKIVVEKLTKTINEDHLQEIFGQYGPIRDLDMPINRQYNTNRGTAYILYIHEADAEAAIAHMHEAIVDGGVINVSIVLPRRKFSPSPPTASRGANIDPRLPAPGARSGGRLGGGGGGGGGFPGGRAGGFAGRQPRSPPRYGGRSNLLPTRTRPDLGHRLEDEVEERTAMAIMMAIEDVALATIVTELVVIPAVVAEDIAEEIAEDIVEQEDKGYALPIV